MGNFDPPRWVVMWVTAAAIFLGCKALAWQSASGRGSVLAWVTWPGLDAARFFSAAGRVCQPGRADWLFAFAKTALGGALFWMGGILAGDHALLRGWLGMAGVVFILHFGLFHVLSCIWRWLGRDALPIMDHPWAAVSVSDFWSRRWNRAFRDLAHRFVFAPLARIVNSRLALLLGFLSSGLIHEAVITVPAGGGYGGPTIYFCVQGLGVALEHSRLGKTLGIAQGWRGWLFAATVVIGPVWLLFPPIFLRNIVLPMMDALGAK